ncbi:MAG: Tad domain-containing protein [Kiritimatiellia bacterium]|nr:Tad domain-containing protein [Kiritimatiellia bacterium]
MTPGRTDSRSGQVMIFLIMVLVILTFVVLWNTDLERFMRVKSLAQDGGDSAALMAARWQGISLNLIGDLNILQALAVAADDQATVDAISNLQVRICFTGPMIGLAASQQAAKNNNIYSHPEFTQILADHADTVRNEYTEIIGDTGEMLFPEPYPGAWDEYADMLDAVAANGVAAGPDNARFYNAPGGGHILLDIGFYEAIAGQSWCWFYNNAPDLLEAYEDYLWWPALPEVNLGYYGNSEIYGLGLTPFATQLGGQVPQETLEAIAEDRGIEGPFDGAMVSQAVWHAYSSGQWGGWSAMTDGSLPLTGELRPQYDYVGADAVARVEAQAHRLTPGPGGTEGANAIVWIAAAKPFGNLEDHGEEPILPTTYELVLPAFTDVRLVPLSASTMPSGGSFNYEWQVHIRDHLPVYMDNGPGGFSCFYCDQLVTWENPLFRYTGAQWLENNSWQCTITPPGGGGGGGGGGAQYGH